MMTTNLHLNASVDYHLTLARQVTTTRPTAQNEYIEFEAAGARLEHRVYYEKGPR